MASEPNPVKAAPDQPRLTRGVVPIQFLLGLVLQIVLALPFLRRTHGMERLRPTQRHLFAVNHISLLDTLLLATLCWRSRCYPILVLGDKNIWHASWIRRFLSRHTAFLLERGKLNPNRIHELEEYGRAGREFQLIVFPEGTRGDGINVAPCQPGIFFIAQAAHIPIVPVFIENMQLISTKNGPFHPLRGLRKVEVHFGELISPEVYLPMPREEFLDLVRQKIAAARNTAGSTGNPWPKVKHLFEKDDGSLPDIFIEGISPDQIITVYEWLMKQCEIYGDPTLWSIEKQQDIPIREVAEPARAFFQRRVESFRHGLTELSVHGVSLPELTVCLDSDGISFDYRMGPEWNEQKVLALFDLLRQVLQLAPQARVKQADEGAHLGPNAEFAEAFKTYITTVDR